MSIRDTQIIYGLATLATCWGAGSLLARLSFFKTLFERKKRAGSIDGIRGFLALGVFIHHYVLTWFWKTEGVWGRPIQPFINNLGKFGVTVFFMISGFLFIRKVAFGNNPVDWGKLYRSRFFRIVPLYFFTVLTVFALSAMKDGASLIEDPARTISQATRWLLFTAGPVGKEWTALLIICGVEWTLRYEWLFYFSLPLIRIWIRMGKTASAILIASCVILFFLPKTIAFFGGLEDWDLFKVELTRQKFFEVYLFFFHTKYLLIFAIGGIGAWLWERKGPFKKLAQSAWGSIIAAIAAVAGLLYPNTLDFVHVLIIGVFFIAIALGSDLFGFLRSKGAIVLGEISYSLYLLHGVALYISYSMIWIPDEGATEERFLAFMPLLGIAVVALSAATYLLVERPAMRFGKRAN